MSAPLTITGGCLCGAVRYEAEGAPVVSVICHCRMCQRASGSPFMAGLFMASDAVRIVKGGLQVYHSSPIADRCFCGQCGSSIIFKHKVQPLTGVAVGSLDDPNVFKPQMHICAETAVAWLDIGGEEPRYDQKPPGMAPPLDYDPVVGGEGRVRKS